jgi:hypothetical protein
MWEAATARVLIQVAEREIRSQLSRIIRRLWRIKLECAELQQFFLVVVHNACPLAVL